MKQFRRIVLTGFMGVGKTTVAKCLALITKAERVDLDHYIEKKEEKSVSEIIEDAGIENFRLLEKKYLKEILDNSELRIISLGGGAWIDEGNRYLIRQSNCTSIWLEAAFEHCWRNIRCSKQRRPLISDKNTVKKLFDERRKFYCLADWHLVIKPEFTSFDVAKIIAEEIL